MEENERCVKSKSDNKYWKEVIARAEARKLGDSEHKPASILQWLKPSILDLYGSGNSEVSKIS